MSVGQRVILHQTRKTGVFFSCRGLILALVAASWMILTSYQRKKKTEDTQYRLSFDDRIRLHPVSYSFKQGTVFLFNLCFGLKCHY